MILHEFYNCDEDGFPQIFKQALKREIRRSQIKDVMKRVAKRGEAYLPPDEQRQIIDPSELRNAMAEAS